MAPSQKLVRLSNKKYCKSDMLNLFRTTPETMNDQIMCSILDQYRSPFIELINTRIHQVYLE